MKLTADLQFHCWAMMADTGEGWPSSGLSADCVRTERCDPGPFRAVSRADETAPRPAEDAGCGGVGGGGGEGRAAPPGVALRPPSPRPAVAGQGRLWEAVRSVDRDAELRHGVVL